MTTIEHEHSFDLFGTRMRLLIGAPALARPEAHIAALRVQARLTRIHAALTRFDPASELSLLNVNAGTTVAISPTMRDAIAAALHAARLSDGLVDPTVLPHLENAGYVLSRAGLQPADLTAALAAAPPRRPARSHPAAAWRRIDLDPSAGTVLVPDGARLDLGGSAKGMAVDKASSSNSRAVSLTSRPSRSTRRVRRSRRMSPASSTEASRWDGARSAHAREQLLERERLGDVVVGAAIQALDLLRRRARRTAR